MTDATLQLAILYSFRRCPYAMRARLAIAIAKQQVIIKEIDLKHKPPELLAISPKATVPVLHLPNDQVLNESLDIMLWALTQNDPQAWLANNHLTDTQQLIQYNDNDFKYYLDRYKYADRYPEHPVLYYRQQGEKFLSELENRLQTQSYLAANHFTIADAAILPFIRQFAAVDNLWFSQSPYPTLKTWLEQFLQSALFNSIMLKQK